MVATPRPISILLVEDTADDERLALRAINRSPCPADVHVARDGEEAIEYLTREPREHPLPDLILLDLKLPKISGVEVLQVIRENKETALLPVIILTSSDEQRDLSDCYRLHGNAYVRKAVNYTEYMEAMKTLLEFWLVINRTPFTDHLPVGHEA